MKPHLRASLLAFLFTCALSAQTVTATVTRVVTDPFGAPVPDAVLVLTNKGTGLELSAKADSSGK
jgi:hypothetical protein